MGTHNPSRDRVDSSFYRSRLLAQKRERDKRREKVRRILKAAGLVEINGIWQKDPASHATDLILDRGSAPGDSGS